MPTPAKEYKSTSESLRRNSAIQDLFKRCEGRHLNSEEYSSYLRQVSNGVAYVDAAREVEQHEQRVVEKTVREIFAIYAFEEHHEAAAAKAPRDITTVSVYATAAMLIRDHDWFRDKLLLWLRTILQSFMFPKREVEKSTAIFGSRRSIDTPAAGAIGNVPQKRQAILETYIVLKRNYQQALSQDSFALFEPYLQQAIDTLAAE